MRTVAEILKSFSKFPIVDICDLLGGRRALILAPHPDDESLGCGGLIAAACGTGSPPIVVILTDGAASHPGSRSYPPERLRMVREAEVVRAACILGLPSKNVLFFRCQDTALPGAGVAFEQIVGRISEVCREYGCQTVFAPWHGDPHCDHEAAARIGDRVAQDENLPLLSYPVWGWLRDARDRLEEPRMGGWRLDIHAEFARKHKAIRAHASQYGGLIKDSPKGFQLPPDLLKAFSVPFEIFIA